MNFITVAFLCILCFFIGNSLNNTNSEKIEGIIEHIDQFEWDISRIKKNTESIQSDVSSIRSDVSSIEFNMK